MGQPLVDALGDPPPCECNCHESLTLTERIQGIQALYRLDDALRGWGYEPLYEMGAHRLWREAQARGGAGYRGIAVRDHACVYRRLVGFLVHESIHALVGDPTRPNHGIPFGLPYGVPESVSPPEEAAYLAGFNAQEARAFVGVGPLASALFGIDWAVYTARDVGTYGLPGGRSLVEVPAGYRPVPHFDRVNEPARYYLLARRLEDEARAWLTPALPDLVERFLYAEAAGRTRATRPAPEVLAARRPRAPGRNDPCPCGSGARYKRCCGAQA